MAKINNLIRPAGFSGNTKSDHVVDCLQNEPQTIDHQEYSTKTNKYKEHYNPPIGKAKFTGTFDKDELNRLTNTVHGEHEPTQSRAVDLLNPRQTTWFTNLLNNVNDRSYEHSKHQLGSQAAKYDSPPIHLHTFGIKSQVGEHVGDVMGSETDSTCPTKFEPGRQLERGYTSSFDREDRFGVVSANKTNDGTNGKLGMEMPISRRDLREGVTICGHTMANWRDLNKHKMSTVRNSIRSTEKLPQDFTFGVASDKDNDGVSHVLGKNKFHDLTNLSGECHSLVADLRKKVKSSGFKNFDELARLLKSENLVGPNKFSNIVNLLRLDLDSLYLSFIVDFCREDSGELNVEKIIKVMDFRNGFHDSNFLNSDFSVDSLHPSPVNTSYSQHIDAAEYGHLSKDGRTYGIPTVRTDLTPPVIKKTSDLTSYGNELSAQAVLNPNVFTNWGLSMEDIARPIGRDEMAELMRRSEISMSEKDFEFIFAKAAGTGGEATVSDFLQHMKDGDT